MIFFSKPELSMIVLFAVAMRSHTWGGLIVALGKGGAFENARSKPNNIEPIFGVAIGSKVL